jgi:hypothetical protein
VAMVRIGACGASSARIRSASFKELLLHAIAVLFETFVIAPGIARRVKKVEAFKDVVGQWVTTWCLAQRGSWPGLTRLQSAVQFAQTRHELRLLLFEHFNIAFGIYFVLGLLPFAEYTNGIVGFTSTAWASSVAF